MRTVLTILDGVIAGEGEGPLAPHDRPLGAIIAAADPLGVDLVAVALMGFDETRVPKLFEAMNYDGLRVTAVRSGSPSGVGPSSTKPAGPATAASTSAVWVHPNQAPATTSPR